MKIQIENSRSFHLQRGLIQLIFASIILYGLIGRFNGAGELYLILCGVNFVAILLSAFIILNFKPHGLVNSFMVNLLLAVLFFIAGNLLTESLTYELVENVQIEPEGDDKEAKVVAIRAFQYSGWEFLWIYLIHAALSYIAYFGSQPESDKASGFSSEVFKVKLGNKVHFLPFKDIEFIEASGNYIHVHSTGKKYTSRMAIQDILQQADKDYLMRIHRSFVININLVRELIPTGEGHSVVLTSGSEVKIGKHYKAALFEHLGLN